MPKPTPLSARALATAASVLLRIYRFQDSTELLLSIQLLVHSSMTIAISAHTPSEISWIGPEPPNRNVNSTAISPEAARPASTPR